ncbi:MAG: type II toxin-antitoxin system ParD family antitoxin [Planctomycetota bacterium]|nr:MAG: type II toxin-antitoxin system ParD family antitoxin [Planctomycetota bacterium]
MNVNLTPDLEKFVRNKVDTGLYNSASEVVREGLRLLAEQDRLREERLLQVREDIQVGLDQARRGELLDGETVIAELRAAIERHNRRARRSR